MWRGLVAALAFLVLAAPTLAQKPGATTTPGTDSSPATTEHIHSFHSDIVVEPSGDLIVTETITLTALGRQIRRGPYRDYPTRYRDLAGHQVRVGFDVLEVLRDGQPEPYHTEGLSNGTRVYIGDADVFLTPGRYTYTLRYRTTRQIYFGTDEEDFDSLYFNVTGNGWDFSIDEASASIHLPAGAEALEIDFFTGPQGSTRTDARVSETPSGIVNISTTRLLGPREGLTFAVSFPKGFVTPPSAAEQSTRWMQDNGAAVIGLLGLLLTFGYYHTNWLRVGKDLPSGTIIPLFEPPTGFSPAASRFVANMQFDQVAFTAAIVSMAVKGYLTIKESGKTFVLEKASGDVSVLSPGEAAIAEELLRTRSSIKLKNTNHAKFQKAIAGLKSSLRKEFEAANFKRNTNIVVMGTMIAIGAVLLTGLVTFSFVIMLQGATWSIGSGVMAALIVHSSYIYVRTRPSIWRLLLLVGSIILALGIAIVALVVAMGVPFGFGLGASLSFIVMGALTPLYSELMKAPTRAGREAMDQIEGFKQYLSVAERHRLEAFHPPEQTPELFEKYLPYALALGVENQWSEQFDDVLKRASADMDDGYHPAWYSGSRWSSVGTAGFVGSLGGAMASSVASAATAPGSSSGGGGFSGGGGGGGGGGGW